MKAAYVFQEFPKWITRKDGSQSIVHSAEEERAELDLPEPQDKRPTPKTLSLPVKPQAAAKG